MKYIRQLLILSLLISTVGCMATEGLVNLHKKAVVTAPATPDAPAPQARLSGNAFWVYPIIVVGFAPCLAFDIVTFPFQLGGELKHDWIGP